MKKQVILLLAFICFSTSMLTAQIAGTIDPAFGNGGPIVFQPGNQHDNLQSLAIQADGKTVFCGTGRIVATTGFNFDMVTGRRNLDGSIDTSFGTNGYVTKDFGVGSDYAYSLAIGATGKIVVVGAKSTTLNDVDWVVACLDANGDYDTTFNHTGILVMALTTGNDFAYDVEIQPDNKIVIAGVSGIAGFSTTKGTLVRLNPNGSLDSTFGVNGVLVSQPAVATYSQTFKSLVVLPNGSMVAGGWSKQSSSDRLFLAGFDSFGNVDSSFGTNGIVTNSGVEKVYSMAHANGFIYAAGVSVTEGTISCYSASGLISAGFGSSGTARYTQNGLNAFYGVLVQPDGKIVVAGTTGSAAFTRDLLTVRYLSNGTIDNAFGVSGSWVLSLSGGFEDLNAVAMQADGKIMVGGFGSFTDNDMILARLLNDSAAIISGMGKIANQKQIWSIYPNPLQGQVIYLASNEKTTAITAITIYTSAGVEVVKLDKTSITTTNQAIKVNLPRAMSNGVYYLKISSKSTVETLPLIITN
ncbi:MAG: T9SS type A sorting domain-containing protein [Bacteroidetes bacterium]|nr:T9SS type A sorting domain-containing protein [Bacteroidota bacterium]